VFVFLKPCPLFFSIFSHCIPGASIAALTVYDMCKAVNKEMIIKNVQLVQKSGGKSDFKIVPKSD